MTLGFRPPTIGTLIGLEWTKWCVLLKALAKLQQSFFENISRMFDPGTWIFIEHARSACRGANIPWARMLCWMARCSYTCLAQPFELRVKYDSVDVVEEEYNTAAYDHCRGSWDQFLPGLRGLCEQSALGAELLQTFVEGPMRSAVSAFSGGGGSAAAATVSSGETAAAWR